MRLIALFALLLLTGCQAELSLHSTPKETQKPSPVHAQAAQASKDSPSLPAKDNSPACMCNPDALKQAVLDRIYESGIGKVIYDNQQQPDRATKAQLDISQRQIDRLGRYRNNIKDHCLQDAYSNWFEFYQSQHDEGIRALELPAGIAKNTYKEDAAQREREVAECKRRGTVPRMVNP